MDRASGPGGFVVYPNPPTDHINLIFPSAGRNWQTDIIAADGRMVQRNVFNNIVQGTMYFSHKLAAGVYFVRITDLQSAASHSTSFVIR